jgi:hypothetical protein
MKNTVYAIVIVVCLTLTGVIVFASRSASRDAGVPNSLQTWVKCLTCGDAHQISLKGFWKRQRAEMSGEDGPSPFLTCTKCGKRAVVEAFKCAQCGEISRKGNPGAMDYEDRCPKCKFSQLEANAKAKAKEEKDQS